MIFFLLLLLLAGTYLCRLNYWNCWDCWIVPLLPFVGLKSETLFLFLLLRSIDLPVYLPKVIQWLNIGIPIRHLPPTSRLSHAQFRRPGTVGLALSRVWSLVDIIRNFLAEPLQSGILNRPISNQQSVGEPYGTIALSSLKFEAEPYARLLFNPVLTHASMGSYIIASCVSCKSI